MYKIKEIFRSIQGEGYNTGKESVFIRFSGCNLWNGRKTDREKAICNFCDTDFVGINGKNGGIYKINDLIETVDRIWESSFTLQKKNVILTGGEPLLQVDEKLVKYLKRRKYKVAVETNGTISSKIDFDWVCVSPKNQNNWLMKEGDELKVIYPQNNFNLCNLLKLNFKHFFLQPKDDKFSQINLKKTIQYCMLNKKWLPSIQLHKVIGVE